MIDQKNLEKGVVPHCNERLADLGVKQAVCMCCVSVYKRAWDTLCMLLRHSYAAVGGSVQPGARCAMVRWAVWPVSCSPALHAQQPPEALVICIIKLDLLEACNVCTGTGAIQRRKQGGTAAPAAAAAGEGSRASDLHSRSEHCLHCIPFSRDAKSPFGCRAW